MQPSSIDETYVSNSRPSRNQGNLQGTVQGVDLVQREITVLVDSQPVNVEIPPQCPVLLRGERIKLRLVQAGDVVQICCTPRAARCVAERVEVAPVNSLPAAGKT
jgi:hypothetical protein